MTSRFRGVIGVIAACVLMAGCTPSDQPSPDPTGTPDGTPAKLTMRVASLKGPTTMGLVAMMDNPDAYLPTMDLSFQVETSPDVIGAKVAAGEIDIALVPANLAAILYAKTKDIQVIGINTVNVLYLVSKGIEIASIDDLAGQTVYSPGLGTTPNVVMDLILGTHELAGKVTVQYLSDPSEVATTVIQRNTVIAVLPEPFVSVVQSKDPSVEVALDLDALFQETTGVPVVTGVTIVRTEFAEAHPEAVTAFLEAGAKSADFTLTSREAAAELIVAQGITPDVEVALTAIPRSGISWLSGEEARPLVMSYIATLFVFNTEMVGGVPPSDGLFRR